MRRGILVLVSTFYFCLTAMAGDGSNLGSQATHYEPPQLSGTVATSAGPSSGAQISAIAGMRGEADGAGDYQLVLDAPGLYTVTARYLLNSQTQEVEVFEGQTINLVFDLGQLCDVGLWPGDGGILGLLECSQPTQANQTETR